MFHGSMVALVTPMLSNADIDYKSLQQLVEWHVECKTDALVVAGTTGESATLSQDEFSKVVTEVVRCAQGRIPVIAGTGCIGTAQTIEKTRHAMELGVDACLIVTPYYVKPTQQGLVDHYTAIAHAVPIPQIMYNVPGRTACDLLPETVNKLAKISNIVGLKEASGKTERYQELLQYVSDRLDIYSGDDFTALDCFLVGGKGVISVTANVAPQEMHDLWAMAQENNKKVNELQRKLHCLHEAMFVQPSPIPVKWALAQMQRIDSGIRLPLRVLDASYHRQVMDALNVFELVPN